MGLTVEATISGYQLWICTAWAEYFGLLHGHYVPQHAVWDAGFAAPAPCKLNLLGRHFFGVRGGGWENGCSCTPFNQDRLEVKGKFALQPPCINALKVPSLFGIRVSIFPAS